MSVQPLRITILGAHGRMGKTLIEGIQEDPHLQLAAGLDQGDDLSQGIAKADVVIDFTHASITAEIAEICVKEKRRLVIGTTGQSEADRKRIFLAAKTIPIVFAPNFSVGVNTLFWLTRQAAQILGENFDLEVVEMHHRHKKDAPSGTARRLAEILAEVRNLEYTKDVRHGREGLVGERTTKEIGMHSLRGGDVVGDHTVIFATQGERLELTHKASSRDTFAQGALRAAKWIIDRSPGLYDMQDVLGLKDQ